MPDALGDFDPQATFDAASRDYVVAGRDYWEYLSHRVVDRLALLPGERVLDVPCGTGPSVLDAAERVGPSGAVVGVDYADGMLAIAREQVAERGLSNVTLMTGDMTALDAPDVPYDAIVCALGVFFVDDMPGLVRSFRSLLNPNGGRLGIAVFGEQFLDPMRDAFRAITAEVAPDVEVVQPWLRANTEAALQDIFRDSGFAFVGIETDDDVHPLPSADVWWQVVMGSSLRRAVTAMGDDAAAEVRRRCAAYIDEHDVREVTTRSRYVIAR
jgi:ubiquinone/menaquinone biosynthesis C-methylase UbiE